MNRINYVITCIFIIFLLSSCTKEGPEGKRTLMNFVPEPEGVNCPAGGYKVEIGLDLNYNNFLETIEVETTEYICNGNNSIIDLQPEPPSENCPSGGYKVMTGIDVNNNNSLEDSEVQNTEYICNGNNSLVKILPEPEGINCTSGGYMVLSGIDINNNNELDETEVQNINYICNGNDGTNSLFIIEQVYPGDICENGGYKIMSGLDINWDQTLDESEVQNIDYVCNGINSIYSVETEQPGENCEEGGFKVNFGMDKNGNGVLDFDEIEDSIYICNGLNGSGDGMIRLTIGWPETTNTIDGIKSTGIYGFNKDDFPGVDSIVFAGIPYSTYKSTSCSIELYDFTADRSILASRIYSDNYDTLDDLEMQYSGNLFNEIPSGKRDLGVYIRCRPEGARGYIKGNCYLYLYRKVRTNN